MRISGRQNKVFDVRAALKSLVDRWNFAIGLEHLATGVSDSSKVSSVGHLTWSSEKKNTISNTFVEYLLVLEVV